MADLSTQPPDAKVFTLDGEAGTLCFGHGVHGAVPPTGSYFLVEYTTYDHGGFVDFAGAMHTAPSSVPIQIAADRVVSTTVTSPEAVAYDRMVPYVVASAALSANGRTLRVAAVNNAETITLTGCSNVFADREGDTIVSPLEYETIGLMGSNLGINELDAIGELNAQVNDLGMDTSVRSVASSERVRSRATTSLSDYVSG